MFYFCKEHTVDRMTVLKATANDVYFLIFERITLSSLENVNMDERRSNRRKEQLNLKCQLSIVYFLNYECIKFFQLLHQHRAAEHRQEPSIFK